jgi:hypothetical protein
MGVKQNKFPESQGCAYAQSFRDSSSCIHAWMPTFVLTKDQFQIGVSFLARLNRWAFSEITIMLHDLDVINLLHFVEFFFFESANFHRMSPSIEQYEYPIVNKTGTKSFKIMYVCGPRVFCTNNNRVFKLYAGIDIPRKVLATQKTMEVLLGYSSNPELIESCDSDGLCAIAEDYYVEDSRITCSHIQSLIDIVDILSTADFVHGDLRRQNIFFFADRAKLIDWEWCDQIVVAKYPANLNLDAFLPR